MEEAPTLGMLRMRITMLIPEVANHPRTEDHLLLLINGTLVEDGTNLLFSRLDSLLSIYYCISTLIYFDAVLAATCYLVLSDVMFMHFDYRDVGRF